MKTACEKCQVCACLRPRYCEAGYEAMRRGSIGYWGGSSYTFRRANSWGKGGVYGYGWPLAIGKCGREVRWLVERPTTVLRSTQTRDLVLLQWELVIVRDLFVDGNGLLWVDHNLFLGLYGDDLGVAVWLQGGKKKALTDWWATAAELNISPYLKYVRGRSLLSVFRLTVQQWLMNRARFPHLVASIIVSWSTLNK